MADGKHTAGFTPGPWVLDAQWSIVTAGGGYVAEAYDGLRGEETDPAIARHNARLIAAAPELLEACKAAEWGGYDTQVDLRYCPVCAGSERTGHTGDCALSAAIARATYEV